MLSIIYLIQKAYTFYRGSSYIPYIVVYSNFAKLFNLKKLSVPMEWVSVPLSSCKNNNMVLNKDEDNVVSRT